LLEEKRYAKVTMKSLYCSYYQANVQRELCLYMVAALRSFEHLAFDRTLDPETSLFEFFVPTSTEEYFLTLMNYLQSEGLIHNLKKLPNRLADSAEQL
jgi:hypothetical protein